MNRHTADRPASVGWTLDTVSFQYPAATVRAVDHVTTSIRPGQFTALVGPNGSGKSTLFRLLLGALRAEEGLVQFGGRRLDHWSRRDLARTIGVVPQNEEITFPLTVRELVLMGRYPHLGALQALGRRDHIIAESAMERCDVLPLADRPISTLSGGERQRARIARAIAQEPLAFAFDEPTIALDLGHEMRIFELARHFTSTGATVLMATHNLNLAARYADTLVLMHQGRIRAAGLPADVFRKDILENVYEWPLEITTHPGPGPDAGAVQLVPVRGGAAEYRDEHTDGGSEKNGGSEKS
ncbi:MAG: ABC transporter ATP-binding protein [Gemmatimonadota bacterium]|jgi:iron complex transport system ATP-binding protein|nr:ABC transporter ATP-binding protein [Gemmatimonadota bacterium]